MDRVFAPISNQVARRLSEIVSKRLVDEPVIALQGPRTVGKSTLLSELACTHEVGVIDLDDPGMRDAVGADPGAFLEGPSPICVD